MRPIVVLLLVVAALAGCSKPAPPVGRWEGTYQSGGTFIVARLELAPGAQVRVSAPDVTDPSVGNNEDRLAMEQDLADRLAGAWGGVDPRRMEFDGAIFRKPGGFAPQIEWDRSANTMTLYVYLGAEPAIHVALRPVNDFSANPWRH